MAASESPINVEKSVENQKHITLHSLYHGIILKKMLNPDCKYSTHQAIDIFMHPILY